jgi:2'-5' RNA ligase
MRLFVAVNFPIKLRRRIASATKSLRNLSMPARWVEPEKLHLTLKFIGEVRDELAEELAEALARAASTFRPFEIHFSQVGAFPSLRGPRIVWLGVELTGDLRFVKHDLEHVFSEMGIERETRAFHPHVTLGRVEGGAKAGAFRELERLARKIEFEDSYRVSHIDLMRSRLRPAGPEYTAFKVAPLARNK